MLLLFTIAGGIALILIGAKWVQKALAKLCGGRLDALVQRTAGSRLRAAGAGGLLAVLTPSSTSIAALTAHLVRTTRVQSHHVLALVLGAGVGLTLLVVLGSVGVERYAPVLLALGAIPHLHGQRRSVKAAGRLLVGLGLVLLGIGLLQTVGRGFAPSGDFGQIVHILEHYPLALAGLAAGLAVALQSSTATILLMAGLGSGGALPLELVVATVAGANVGTALTMCAISWGATGSRRAALGNLGVRLIVAAASVGMAGPIAAGLARLPTTFELQAAYAHVGFNVVVAALGLALLTPLDRLARRFVPEQPVAAGAFGPRYVVGPADADATVALGRSMREILRVSEIARQMLDDAWRALRTGDLDLARSVGRRDDDIDLLDREIKRFLVSIAEDLEPEEAIEQMRQLRYLSELETIGDLIDKNISELIVKAVRLRLRFQPDDWRELGHLVAQVRESMLLAETAFHLRDRRVAETLLERKESVGREHRRLRDAHLARITPGSMASLSVSAVHLDLLTYLKQIHNCLCHIAYAAFPAREETRGESNATAEPRAAGITAQAIASSGG